MSRPNDDIRERAKQKGVCLYQIADRVGMQDSNFSRKLRKELTDGEKKRIFKIIDELAEEGI
jgi:hypothetical protein